MLNCLCSTFVQSQLAPEHQLATYGGCSMGVGGWVGGKSDWWVITGPLLLPACLLLRSGGVEATLPPSRHLLTHEPPLTGQEQLVPSAKVPVITIAGLLCFCRVLVLVLVQLKMS